MNHCKTCVYYAQHSKTGVGTEFGSCRFSSPIEGHPLVLPSDFCGKHTEKSPSAGCLRSSTRAVHNGATRMEVL